MKYLHLVFLLLIIHALQAQEYKPFHAGSKKLFTSDLVPDTSFSIQFDSVRLAGVDSLYYNHTLIESIPVPSDSCMFWGGPFCQKQIMTWLGTPVRATPSGSYTFYTRTGDSLTVDFSLSPGDSAGIFQDNGQVFRLISEGKDTLTWLGFTDSVAIFRISHANQNGNPINSLLNQYPVYIGKQLGLITFFRVDQFPALIQPMSLRGNADPELGKTKITAASLYDHQPGDVIQYYESHSGFGPLAPWQRYTKHTFLSRTESPDSLIYSVQESFFEPGNPQQSEDTITLSYYRHTLYAELPFDRLDPSANYVERTLALRNYCGVPRWTYTLNPLYLSYCASENCWGMMDSGGPPDIQESILTEGLGLYHFSSGIFAPPPQGYSYQRSIHYFRKNGQTCGNEAVLSADAAGTPGISARLIPNPAGETVSVEAIGFRTAAIWLCSPDGKVISTTEMQNSRCDLSLSGLQNGLYFVRICTEKGVTNLKLLKQGL